MTAMADRIPVTGTWPFRKPSSADRSSCWSISRPARTTGSPVTAAGRSMAAKRSPGLLMTNSAASPRPRISSTVTIESMPPPKGMSMACGPPGSRPGPLATGSPMTPPVNWSADRSRSLR